MTQPLIIGTRASPLARRQGEMAAALLKGVDVEFKTFTTTGDKVLDKPLVEFGGKGLFTKELDDALLKGEIDCAVHSAKDLPAVLPEGIVLAAILKREDPRDVFIGRDGMKFHDLPQGAHIGSASLRRIAQIHRIRPDITTGLLRGNVGTRISKVQDGQFHGTLLAAAGLNRLGLMQDSYELLPLDVFLPAAGQGILAITARAVDKTLLPPCGGAVMRSMTEGGINSLVDAVSTNPSPYPLPPRFACEATQGKQGEGRSLNSTRNDGAILDQLLSINCSETASILSCERAFLRRLGASCRMSLAGYAELEDDQIVFHGQFYGTQAEDDASVSISGPALQAEQLGEEAAEILLAQSSALREILKQNDIPHHPPTA